MSLRLLHTGPSHVPKTLTSDTSGKKGSQPLDPCWTTSSDSMRLLTHNHILLSKTHKGECVHQGGFQCLPSKRDQKTCSLPRFSFFYPSPSSLVSNQVSPFQNYERTKTCRGHHVLWVSSDPFLSYCWENYEMFFFRPWFWDYRR